MFICLPAFYAEPSHTRILITDFRSLRGVVSIAGEACVGETDAPKGRVRPLKSPAGMWPGLTALVTGRMWWVRWMRRMIPTAAEDGRCVRLIRLEGDAEKHGHRRRRHRGKPTAFG